MINCANCKVFSCNEGSGCVNNHDFSSFIDFSKQEYDKKDNKKILEVSTQIEGEHYMEWTRLEEVIDFIKQMDYKNVGIAHCIGLASETEILKEILKKIVGVNSICCKFSGIEKNEYKLTKIDCKKYESICNPIGQAKVLNDLKTELNIVIGLCVGHDILFNKYSDAPVTTFIVKDRVTGHNPAIALYSNYYRKKL